MQFLQQRKHAAEPGGVCKGSLLPAAVAIWSLYHLYSTRSSRSNLNSFQQISVLLPTLHISLQAFFEPKLSRFFSQLCSFDQVPQSGALSTHLLVHRVTSLPPEQLFSSSKSSYNPTHTPNTAPPPIPQHKTSSKSNTITAGFKQVNFHSSQQDLLMVLDREGFDFKNGNSVMIKSI